MSAVGTGAISYMSPKGIIKQLWVRGTGTGSDATYDTVLVNASSETSDKLIQGARALLARRGLERDQERPGADGRRSRGACQPHAGWLQVGDGAVAAS